MTRKCPLPIAGSKTFKSKTASAGSRFCSSPVAAPWFACHGRQLFGAVFERFETLLHKWFESVIDDKVDQLLRSEEAAAVLACVRVWANS